MPVNRHVLDQMLMEGIALDKAGDSAQAEAIGRRILALQPEHFGALQLVGLIASRAGRFDLAAELLGKAVRINRKIPELFLKLGVALAELGQPREAEANYRRALALRPDYAVAHNNLGVALQLQGKLDEALICYKRALAIKPDYIGAFHNFATCRKATTADQALLEKIEKLLARPETDEESRITAHFALGKCHDDLARYPEAFRHYQLANALEGSKYRFDRELLEQKVSRLVETYTADFFAQRASWGNPSELPILIVGMPRSGTTLVEQIVASHPRACGAGELEFWFEQTRNLPADFPAGFSEAAAASIADHYLALLRSFSHQAAHVTDKMPRNFLRLGLIHLLFPRARIIHCMRDPIDTGLSIYFQRFTGYHAFARNLDDIVFYYRQYLRLMDHWRTVLPPDVLLEIRYEDLVAGQEKTSRRIVAFYGLEWNEKCLDFHKASRIIATASSWQARQPMYTGSVGRWQHYAEFIGPLAQLAE